MDVRRQRFARARVRYVRAHRVDDFLRQPAHDVDGHVLVEPVRILFGSGRVQHPDGVGEARRLEGRQPHQHAGLEVGPPAFGHTAPDVVSDGLDGVADGGPGVLLFQPEARDVLALFLRAAAGRLEFAEGHREVAHPRVGRAAGHGLFGQEDEGMADHHRHRLRPGGRGSGVGGQEGQVRAHVERVAACAHAPQEGLAGVHRCGHDPEEVGDEAARRRGGHIRRKGGRDVQQQRAVGLRGDDRQVDDQSAGLGGVQRVLDRPALGLAGCVAWNFRLCRFGLGASAPIDRRAQVAQEDRVAQALEAGQPLADLQILGGRPRGHRDGLGVPEQGFAQRIGGQCDQRALTGTPGGDAAAAQALGAFQQGIGGAGPGRRAGRWRRGGLGPRRAKNQHERDGHAAAKCQARGASLQRGHRLSLPECRQ